MEKSNEHGSNGGAVRRHSPAIVAALLGVACTAVYDRITIGSAISNHEARIAFLERQAEKTDTAFVSISVKLDEIKATAYANSERLQKIEDRQNVVLDKLRLHLNGQ